MARVSLIVAMSRNRVIGRDNRLPWHLPEDLKRFKQLTLGHHIVMGRKTWASIGRLLPGRTTVIVTRDLNLRVPGATLVRSLTEALQMCEDDSEVFVIGGAQIFQAALPLVQRIYLTTIETDIDGDVRMPEIDWTAWRRIESESHPVAPGNALPWTFAIYERIRPETTPG